MTTAKKVLLSLIQFALGFIYIWLSGNSFFIFLILHGYGEKPQDYIYSILALTVITTLMILFMLLLKKVRKNKILPVSNIIISCIALVGGIIPVLLSSVRAFVTYLSEFYQSCRFALIKIAETAC